MTRRHRTVRLLALLLLIAGAMNAWAIPARAAGATYTNPLPIETPTGPLESCPDPAIIRGQQPGDRAWYLYCTMDPHTSADREPSGAYHFHLLSMFRSFDLVHWAFVGDAFPARPSWAAPQAYLWAPDIEFFAGRYYLYYTVTETVGTGGSAVGVATSASPTGPWGESSVPIVAPQAAPCCADSHRWNYDPTVITDRDGQRYLLFGSYFGGINARRLSADGLRTDPASETPIALSNRYEGAAVVRHGDFYYLFASSTNCCNGALTGYTVFVGRSARALGPYTDRDGVSFLDGQVGGTPVVQMNGNRWVGPGHNSIVTDFAGQDWFFYHAVDRNAPYFAGAPGFTRRPLLLDPLDWRDGWPVVRGGLGASDTPIPAPAAQPGEKSAYRMPTPRDEPLGLLVSNLSDEFNPPPRERTDESPPGGMSRQWQWVRPPPATAFGLVDGTFRMATADTDLFADRNDAAVLTEPAPSGDYTVETRVRLGVPNDGSTHNTVQAGLVIYGNDDNYLKLVHVSLDETRQTEWAKELFPVPDGTPRYGNTVVGAPAAWTYLRVVKRGHGAEEWYTAYTSRDGNQWARGGTWTHALGRDARIGLVAMGGAGFSANFDYVRVYTVPGGGIGALSG